MKILKIILSVIIAILMVPLAVVAVWLFKMIPQNLFVYILNICLIAWLSWFVYEVFFNRV
jgi:uncharacterized membrane protein YfcA